MTTTLNTPIHDDLGLGEALRRVEAGASPEWKEAAMDALRTVSRTHNGTFSSDQVWAELEAQGVSTPVEPRAMGPIMVWGKNEGLIERVGSVPSKRRRGFVSTYKAV